MKNLNTEFIGVHITKAMRIKMRREINRRRKKGEHINVSIFLRELIKEAVR